MYQRKQIGWIILILLPLVGLAPLGSYLLTGEIWVLLAYLPIALLLLGFSVLNVRVDDQQVRVAFSVPLFARKIPIADIKAARPVRNKWWYGWGIRYLGPDGWMYNVHGLDAVELELASNKKFRIGTDDPAGLTEAITTRLR